MNCSSAAGQETVPGGTNLTSIIGKEDTVKNQFVTREGTYKLMSSSDYCRTTRVGYTTTPQTNTPVKCSFLSVTKSSTTSSSSSNSHDGDKICFNVGKDLYVYNYKGVKKVGIYKCLNYINLLSDFGRFVEPVN